ncbi:MAG: lysostaphin resistance A-like protein [Acidimicrobiales bacterium]
MKAPAIDQSGNRLQALRIGCRAGTGGFVLGALLLVYYGATFNSTRPGEVPSWSTRASVRAGVLAVSLLLLALCKVAAWMLAKGGERAAWLDRPRWGCRAWGFVYVFPGLLATWLLAILVEGILRHFDPVGPTYNDLAADASTSVLWAAFVASVVVAPVLEELFYRGCLQSWLRRRLPAAPAIGLATAVFTLTHGLGPLGYGPADLAAVAVVGLFYGVLFEKTGGLSVPIAGQVGGVSVFWSLCVPALIVIAVVAGDWWWRRRPGVAEVGSPG